MKDNKTEIFHPDIQPEGLYEPTRLKCGIDVDMLTYEISNFLRMQLFAKTRYEDGDILVEMGNGRLFTVSIRDV